MQEQLRQLFAEIGTATDNLFDQGLPRSAKPHGAADAAARQASASSAPAAGIYAMNHSIGEVSQIARQTEENSALTADLSNRAAAW